VTKEDIGKWQMKKAFDKNGRTIYRFSHGVGQGGNIYCRKSNMHISNKEGLRNVLTAISKKYKLSDYNIKVYDTIFFLFFHIPKSLAPADLIDSIQANIASFADWDKDYLYTAIYDLQEKDIKNYLKKFDFNYDEG